MSKYNRESKYNLNGALSYGIGRKQKTSNGLINKKRRKAYQTLVNGPNVLERNRIRRNDLDE